MPPSNQQSDPALPPVSTIPRSHAARSALAAIVSRSTVTKYRLGLRPLRVCRAAPIVFAGPGQTWLMEAAVKELGLNAYPKEASLILKVEDLMAHKIGIHASQR